MTELNETPKAKPGPKAKPKVSIEEFNAMKDRLTNLEAFLGKMAHQVGGNVPRVCKEFGIKVYEPQAKDMSRYG